MPLGDANEVDSFRDLYDVYLVMVHKTRPEERHVFPTDMRETVSHAVAAYWAAHPDWPPFVRADYDIWIDIRKWW